MDAENFWTVYVLFTDISMQANSQILFHAKMHRQFDYGKEASIHQPLWHV